MDSVFGGAEKISTRARKAASWSREAKNCLEGSYLGDTPIYKYFLFPNSEEFECHSKFVDGSSARMRLVARTSEIYMKPSPTPSCFYLTALQLKYPPFFHGFE